MDESYSTDAWMNNRRVLDIITETVFCVGEVLEDYVEKFALASFSSKTRRSCRFNVVKSFHEPWATAAGRLGSLQPRDFIPASGLRYGMPRINCSTNAPPGKS